MVLYNSHRQTTPLLKNVENRKKYIFLEMSQIWRYIPIRSKKKAKYRVIYLMLSFLAPKYIIDINWITTQHGLYKIWTNKHKRSKFIVIQHGSYVGGVVTDKAHRYTKCDAFLTWGPYFTDLFKKMNAGKQVDIKSFGNPVYNEIERSEFSYPMKKKGNILLAPSGIKGERLRALYALKEKLVELDFKIYLKEHNFQSRKFQKIYDIERVEGSASEVLSTQAYDVVVTDHSSLMLDAIFYKNPVFYFSAPGNLDEYEKNKFVDYLGNVFEVYQEFQCKSDVYKLIDVNRQEEMFSDLVSIRSNRLCIN